MKQIRFSFAIILAGSCAHAQDAPLSAIRWLDQAAVTLPAPEKAPDEAPVSSGVTTPVVVVQPLDSPHPDAVGLLPTGTTGLPRDIWENSRTETLTGLFAQLPQDPLPATQALYYTLLLAEADAPRDTDNTPRLLKTRLKALQEFGAVESALALVKRADPRRKALFDQWFDLSLLSGQEAEACAALIDDPDLTGMYGPRIYCNARNNDWQTAALVYDNAVALEALEPVEAQLLAYFLDPAMIESGHVPPPPRHISPLIFRLYEAAGSTLPTRNLPRAFAMADLREVSGWKAQIEAAERLTRSSALPATQLLGIYTAREPAASGGVWDRVAAIQKLDRALAGENAGDIATALPKAWDVAESQNLEIAFAQLFQGRLAEHDLPETVGQIVFHINLLSPQYESAVSEEKPATAAERFLVGLTKGKPGTGQAQTGLEKAVAAGFAKPEPPQEFASLLENGQFGEVILRAAQQLDRAGRNNFDDITSSLKTLRHLGLEDTARRAALQLLLLDA